MSYTLETIKQIRQDRAVPDYVPDALVVHYNKNDVGPCEPVLMNTHLNGRDTSNRSTMPIPTQVVDVIRDNLKRTKYADYYKAMGTYDLNSVPGIYEWFESMPDIPYFNRAKALNLVHSNLAGKWNQILIEATSEVNSALDKDVHLECCKIQHKSTQEMYDLYVYLPALAKQRGVELASNHA